MGAEVIALGLEEVGREAGAAEAVEEGEGGAEGGDGDAFADGAADDFAPGALAAFDGLFEEGVEEEVGELGVLVEGLFDVAEEGAADNAAAAPHEGDTAAVEVPAVLLGGGAHEHVALGVADDFGGVEGFADICDPGGAVAGETGVAGLEVLGGFDAGLLHGRHAAGVDGFGDEGNGDAEVLGGDDGPFAGAFLAGGVEDFVDQRGAVVVFFGEDIAGDFDEVGIELAAVPVGEDLVHLVGGEAESVLEEVVGFADELHIAVFDPVMGHLDIVAGAAFADPVAAGGAVGDFGGDGLEDGLDVRPGGGAAAGHDAGAVPGAFLAAGDSGSDVEEAFGFDVGGAADGVLEEAIAAVDDDVAGFEDSEEAFDELVDRLAGFDHEHDAARAFEEGGHFGEGVGAEDAGAFGFLVEEVVDFGDGAVVGHDREAMVVHVEDEVLAHDGQSDDGDISVRFHVQYESKD